MPTTDQLSALKNLTDSTLSYDNRPRTRRGPSLPSWLLPVVLFSGFFLVLLVLFGERMLPATEVRVAPVVTIRSDRPLVEVTSPNRSPETSGNQSQKGALLFQASGWVEPDPFPISVSTLVGGIVEEVFVLEGESVTKDQVLARLVDEDAVLDLDEKKARVETLKNQIAAEEARIPFVAAKRTGSESNVASERSRLAELQDRLERLRSLPRGSIPAVEVKASELQVEQQKAKLARAESDIPSVDSELEMVQRDIAAMRSLLREAEVAQAKAKLAFDRHTIRAPMDGIILHLHAAPGAKRMIHMDDPKSGYIVELFDPDKLQARIDVPLSEAASLAVGQPVEMTTDLLPNAVLEGGVTRITGSADLQRNTLQVKVRITEPDPRLRPEMLVRGKFYPVPQPRHSTDMPERTVPATSTRLVIFVPGEAIKDDRVWVVSKDERAEIREIEIGDETRDGHQLVTGGVRSGERVILPPHKGLKPGDRIRITP